MSQLARPSRFACVVLLLAGAMPAPARAQPPARPAALPPVAEAVELFDPHSVQLSWHDRRWLLVHQGQTLKDFGPRFEEARLALSLIQQLGLNQRGVIGSPVPHMEYWLVDGHAPGPLSRAGMNTFPVEPDLLRVEQAAGQWVVRDADRVLFNFGEYADEARAAVAVLRKHRFTQVAVVGQVTPTMVVFGGKAQTATPTLATRGASSSFAPREITVARIGDGPRAESMKGAQGTPAPGYAGVVQPLVPPLSAPAPDRAAPTFTAGNLHAVAFHTQPHFGQEGRRVFDWRQVQVRQDGGAWQLAAGGQVLTGFGGDLRQAQSALAAIRYYRFTEVRPGGNGPAYCLAHGASPRGLLLGLTGTEVRPDKLDVQRRPEGYAVCQGSLAVLQFGDRPEPAREALEVIQRQKLDRVCHIGGGRDGLTILVKTRDEFRLPAGSTILPSR